MKKLSLLIFCGLTLTNAYVFAENKSNVYKTISVVIENNANKPLYNARIKTNNGNTWKNIGNIVPGINNFNIEGILDSNPCFFEVQLENGQWLIGVYHKNESKKITFGINQDAQHSFKISSSESTTSLIPISTKYASMPSMVSCTNTYTGYTCYISQLGIFYYATGKNLSQNYVYGYFGTNLSPYELIQKYHNFGSTNYRVHKSYISVSPSQELTTIASFGLFQDAGLFEGSGYFRPAF